MNPISPPRTVIFSIALALFCHAAWAQENQAPGTPTFDLATPIVKENAPPGTKPEPIATPASISLPNPQLMPDSVILDPPPDASFYETIPLLDEPAAATPTPGYSRRLRLFLRELSMLQDAARSVGGEIQVSVTPVGVTPEDLVIPLTRLGYFDVLPESDVIIVRSKAKDPYLADLEKQVAELEHRRALLLNDVKLMEAFAKNYSVIAETAHRAENLPTTKGKAGLQTRAQVNATDGVSAAVPTVILTPKFNK